jgi:hypothetical protein
MFRPVIKSIDHIVVAVKDINRSADWYHVMLYVDSFFFIHCFPARIQPNHFFL